jgi:hypothetical protein
VLADLIAHNTADNRSADGPKGASTRQNRAT